MSVSNNSVTLEELDFISDLQRQEAFEDSGEDANNSRRASANRDQKDETPEETLQKIISAPAPPRRHKSSGALLRPTRRILREGNGSADLDSQKSSRRDGRESRERRDGPKPSIRPTTSRRYKSQSDLDFDYDGEISKASNSSADTNSTARKRQTRRSPNRTKSSPLRLQGRSALATRRAPRRDDSKSGTVDIRSMATRSQSTLSETSIPEENKRKTKLEKIHELQAECDRHKRECLQVTKEKRQARRDLESKNLEVISLTKDIETHVAEISILRKNFSEALENLDMAQEELRQERIEYSNAAKDLAQARIDHAKSLNETRELKVDLDKLEGSISERDKRVATLAGDLQASKDKAKEMIADITFAEKEITKLEGEIKRLEEELITYRVAAEKDDVNGNNENVRKARDEMEQRLHEERERRLEQKQEKLDEKIRQFEGEREKYLQDKEERERELENWQKLEDQKQKEREEERLRVGGEINQRLQELEDDNKMLQGRLKSEQLDSHVQLKAKDESIKKLKKELLEAKQELDARDSDPNGNVVLQKEIKDAKAELAMARDDIEEAKKHNGMLEDEIEVTQTTCSDLRTEISSLQKELTTVKRDAEFWKKKAEEWQGKSGEWSDKAFQWKDKAEHWEKMAKDSNPDANPEAITAPVAADPQALFLQAALEKKKASSAAAANAAAGGRRWLGGMWNKGSEDTGDDPQLQVKELEEANAKQLETIKSLRSEMVKIQTMFKEEAYGNQQKMQQLQKEKEAVELKNTNLMKELGLARKLENFAAS